MTEMSGLDREVTPQGNATDKIPWYGVYPSWDPVLSLGSSSGSVFGLTLGRGSGKKARWLVYSTIKCATQKTLLGLLATVTSTFQLPM